MQVHVRPAVVLAGAGAGRSEQAALTDPQGTFRHALASTHAAPFGVGTNPVGQTQLSPLLTSGAWHEQNRPADEALNGGGRSMHVANGDWHGDAVHAAKLHTTAQSSQYKADQ
jgi:hypothetical protein